MAEQRKDVQGLRAVAIGSVLLFHFFPEYFKNGFLGVDIFFVISGFLINGILDRCETYDAASMGSFYFRRIKRILPLYVVYVCVAIGLFIYYATPTTIRDSQFSSIYALIFSTNFHSIFEKDDYFKRLLGDNLFTHTWSLSVEVQFYFLVPFLFLLRSLIPRPSLSSLLFPSLFVLSLLSFILLPPLYSFNVVLARIWQFFSTSLFEKVERTPIDGGSLPQMYKLLPQDDEEPEVKEVVPSSRSKVVAWIYISSFGCLLLPFFPFVLEPISTRIFVTIAAAIIIIFGEGHENPLLASRPFEFIGDVSYSLYLFHWPFSVYFVKSTPVLSFLRFALIPFSVSLTVLVYFTFERYYRRWSREVVSVFVVVFYAVAAALIFVAPSLNQRVFDAKSATTAKKIADAIRTNEFVFSHPNENLIIEQCNYSDWRNLSLPQHKAHIQKPFGICKMPNGTGKLKFAAIGNSYCPNQADLVWKHFSPFFSTFTMFSQMACEVFTYTHSGYCGHFANYTDVLTELKPDVTFIIQRYGAPKNPLHPAGQNDTELMEMLDHLEEIRNMSSLYFIMDSFPAFDFYAFLGMNDMIRKNVSVDEINAKIVIRGEDATARPRTKQLAEACGPKCKLYDVEPGLVDSKGQMVALDGSTYLAYFEPSGHLAPWGRQHIEYIYENLAKQYANELNDLAKKLYP